MSDAAAAAAAAAADVSVVFQLACAEAQVPARATPGSAGYDLSSCEHVTLGPGVRRLVDTGVRVVLSSIRTYARIAPRSGLALRGIDVLAGVCDSDYRGTYRVLLVNNTGFDFQVKPGDRIAQIVFEAIVHPTVRVADPETDLAALDAPEAAVRGVGGFGST
jgi:dUTP pyrophosphatase